MQIKNCITLIKQNNKKITVHKTTSMFDLLNPSDKGYIMSLSLLLDVIFDKSIHPKIITGASAIKIPIMHDEMLFNKNMPNPLLM